MDSKPPLHAVARLRAAHLTRSMRPFLARGGPKGERCEACRLILSHCLCAWRVVVPTQAGVCLLMGGHEVLKPSNTGWLIADVVPDTMAFSWARLTVDPALLALLADETWQPYLVFPGEFVAPERVITQLPPAAKHEGRHKRPLFILLDATWPEARKIFKQSAYLQSLPVLSLQAQELSRYRLRRSRCDQHLCTSEVAALCLHMAGDTFAARTLQAYLELFTEHYLAAKLQKKINFEGNAHQAWRALQLELRP